MSSTLSRGVQARPPDRTPRASSPVGCVSAARLRPQASSAPGRRAALRSTSSLPDGLPNRVVCVLGLRRERLRSCARSPLCFLSHPRPPRRRVRRQRVASGRSGGGRSRRSAHPIKRFHPTRPSGHGACIQWQLNGEESASKRRALQAPLAQLDITASVMSSSRHRSNQRPPNGHRALRLPVRPLKGAPPWRAPSGRAPASSGGRGGRGGCCWRRSAVRCLHDCGGARRPNVRTWHVSLA